MSTLPQAGQAGNGAGASTGTGTPAAERKKVTLFTLREKAARGVPLTMVTAYDYPSALAVEAAGLDLILVGDSVGMVVHGFDSTLPVTMEMMILHAQAVSRGARHPLLIGDMPFLSYQADLAEAVRNAGRFLKEAGMDAVKLEGGREVVPIVAAIVRAGIPVMGHIGLTPQSVSLLGGYRVQGKTAQSARTLLADAQALEAAGCFALVLESVPDRVATWITGQLGIPTIGIGAGAGCSGQVLVYHDLLGLFERFTPKFVRRYAGLHAATIEALAGFRDDVLARRFPAAEHCYTIDPDEWRQLEGSS
jgi:3-methyl-2-oxobutanoate hydroxymethyltransferase